MRRSSISQIILIIFLCCFYAYSQSENYLNNLEEIRINIENPTAIIPITKFDDDKSSVEYIIKTYDQLIFVDENYKKIFSRKIQSGDKTIITTSKQCKYLLLYEILTYPQKEEYGKAKLTLIDYTNKEYWSKENHVILDQHRGPVKRFISDYNGYVFEILCNDSLEVKAFNRNGEIVKEVYLFPDIDKWSGIGLFNDITNSGEYFAILANKYFPMSQAVLKRVPERGKYKGQEIVKNREFQDGEPSLFLFNYSCELLKKMKCNKQEANGIYINDDNSLYTIVSTSDIGKQALTSVYNKDLTLLFTLPVIPRVCCIQNGQIIIGNYDENEGTSLLSGYDIKDGEQQWSVPIEYNPLYIYTDKKNKINIISAEGPTFDNPIETFSLHTYDSNGNKDRDVFLNVELKYSGFERNSIRNIWENSYFIVDNKIYRVKNN